MELFVKLIINDSRIRSTPSIYISIMLTYLELLNWEEAEYIVGIMKDLELEPEEALAFNYLKDIVNRKDEEAVTDLLAYLQA